MDFVTVILMVVYGYAMYAIGKSAAMKMVGSKHIQDTLARAAIPIGVLEKVEGHYYLYEKQESRPFGASMENLGWLDEGKH